MSSTLSVWMVGWRVLLMILCMSLQCLDVSLVLIAEREREKVVTGCIVGENKKNIKEVESIKTTQFQVSHVQTTINMS